ncbi:MAG: MotA/TolQ/ExbB proton channel family protein [Prevotella sp.]|nr:MotA/TolQ/ExbB proton channel family protein [Prevotella sp.]
MNKMIAKFAITIILLFSQYGFLCANPVDMQMPKDTVKTDTSSSDTSAIDVLQDEKMLSDADFSPVESEGLHKSLKRKFIEGNAVFMSFVALVLVIGLAFCIERIIFLTLSEIDAKRFMGDVGKLIDAGNIDEAKKLCHNTRGPVSSLCEKTLERIDESVKDIERAIVSYGSVQSANMEVGCSWITMFIAMAPSLGFLGTVVGIVMTFEQIQSAGDISPTIVAAGMKVALLTTIFGIVSALVLQLFYNYILSKIEHITSQMEESAISLIDDIIKYKQQKM